MPAAVGTITSTGQVSLPKVMRDILGVKPGDQVEFVSDGERVQVVAVSKDPLTLGSPEEFWASVARSDAQYEAGQGHPLSATVGALRKRHGL